MEKVADMSKTDLSTLIATEIAKTLAGLGVVKTTLVDQNIGQVGQQGAEQIAQAIAQNSQKADQALATATQSNSSLATDRKVMGYDNISEDTDTAEAHRGATFENAQMWGVNKKRLVENALTVDKMADLLKIQRQADSNVYAKAMEHIQVQKANNNALIEHLASLKAIGVEEYVDG